MCIIGSPPCALLRMLQELTKVVEKDDGAWTRRHGLWVKEVVKHIRSVCVLYRYQIKKGRHIVDEHPWLACSWAVKRVKDITQDPKFSVAYATCANTARPYTSMCVRGLAAR